VVCDRAEWVRACLRSDGPKWDSSRSEFGRLFMGLFLGREIVMFISGCLCFIGAVPVTGRRSSLSPSPPSPSLSLSLVFSLVVLAGARVVAGPKIQFRFNFFFHILGFRCHYLSFSHHLHRASLSFHISLHFLFLNSRYLFGLHTRFGLSLLFISLSGLHSRRTHRIGYRRII